MSRSCEEGIYPHKDGKGLFDVLGSIRSTVGAAELAVHACLAGGGLVG